MKFPMKSAKVHAHRSVLAVALGLVPAFATAQPQQPPARVGLTDAEAGQIALARVPGTVVRIEREDEHGRHIVEVHVRDGRGRVMGVEIDDATHRIVGVDREEADEAGEDEAGEREGRSR